MQFQKHSLQFEKDAKRLSPVEIVAQELTVENRIGRDFETGGAPVLSLCPATETADSAHCVADWLTDMSLPLQSHAETTPDATSSSSGSGPHTNPTFPFTAACHDSDHSSGLDLQVDVKPGRYCTGAVLHGHVTIQRLAACKFPREIGLIACVRSLAIRVSCETRCMFWTIVDEKDRERELDRDRDELKENQPTENGQSRAAGDLGQAIERTLSRTSPKVRRKHGGKLGKGGKAGTAAASVSDTVRWCLEPEWARATIGEIACISNGALQARTDSLDLDQVVLPFQVTLPTEIAFDEWNSCPGADRSMHRLVRPAPSSCRDRQDASVEWIVEAVLDLRYSSRVGASASNQVAGMAAGSSCDNASIKSTSTTSFDLDQLDPWTNTRGFCISKPSRLVTRAVFDVIAADLKLAGHDLRDSMLASFASGERARLRTHAGKLQENEADASVGTGAPNSNNSTSAHYKKVIELRTNALSTRIGTLTVEVRETRCHGARHSRNNPPPFVAQLATHSPMYLSRKNLRSSLSMYLDWQLASNGFRRAISSAGGSDKYRLVSASMTMEGWSWTRGGNGKIRREVMPLR